MNKTALLFPGQGAHYVGMGKDFHDQFRESRDIFDQANEILKFDLKSLCFHGTQEELNKTSLCQPAIFVTSVAIWKVLEKRAIIQTDNCCGVAGLSLGEYTAHVLAGSISFADAVRLVYKRGMYMQEACNASPGGMVAIIGLNDEKVEQICVEVGTSGVICPANYNSPGQIVISGEKKVLEKAANLAKERGAKLVRPLQVDGAFHSDLMSPACSKLAKELDATPITESKIPVVANIHAQYVTRPEDVKATLAKQLNHPVRWHQSMCMLIKDGFNEFYEIGPGRTLTGLMKKIDPTQSIKNMSTSEDLQ